METTELLEIISKGEDSSNQFKSDVTNTVSLASELVAFSNSDGGTILIGVDDEGNITNLNSTDISRLNQIVSNAASEGVKPAINPRTENINTSNGLVMIITVPKGNNRPYMDKNGTIWVKSGADKRKATSREEIQRMFQSAGIIHADATPAEGLTTADVDIEYFSAFFEKNYGESLEEQNIPLPQTIENLNLMKNGTLNISGALLFAKSPNRTLPVFMVKAVSYPNDNISQDNYIDSQDITGKLSEIYDKSINFVLRNIKHTQNNQGINSIGKPEIPKIVLEELIVNALTHRDYFVSSPIRIFIFSDRLEIISPGHLPNDLTIENIKNGNSNIRNPILTSFASRILPYRGLGSGILRAMQAYEHITFENDRDGNKFKVIVKRTVC